MSTMWYISKDGETAGIDDCHTIVSCGVKRIRITAPKQWTEGVAKRMWKELRAGLLQGHDSWAHAAAAFWIVPTKEIEPVIAFARAKVGYTVLGSITLIHIKARVSKDNGYVKYTNELLADDKLKPSDRDYYFTEGEG